MINPAKSPFSWPLFVIFIYKYTLMGLQTGFMGLGGVLCITLGGALAQQNWHFPFGIYLFAWLIVPLMGLFMLEASRAEPAVRSSETIAPSTAIALLAIIDGLTTLSQIAFYLIPVQLPFF